MKSIITLAALCAALPLSSCSSTYVEAPVHKSSGEKPKTKKPATPPSDGALHQVPAEKPKDKTFPEIPLKEDTGTSPLIKDKPDTPTYKRSSP